MPFSLYDDSFSSNGFFKGKHATNSLVLKNNSLIRYKCRAKAKAVSILILLRGLSHFVCSTAVYCGGDIKLERPY